MGVHVKKMDLTGLSPEYIQERAKLSRCVVCSRPMRPAGSRAADWPATVAYGTGSRCKSCYNRVYLAKRDAEGTKVERVRKRGRVIETPVVVQPRAQVAERWSPEARSAALLVCDAAPSASVAGEILEMLGLFDVDPVAGFGFSYAPKGNLSS